MIKSLPLDSVRIERFGSRNQNPGQIIFPEAPSLQGPLVSCKQKKNSFLAYKILINPQFLMVKVEALSCCCLWPRQWGQKCIPRPHTCYRRLKAQTELFPSLYSASLEVFSFKRWRLPKIWVLYGLGAFFSTRIIQRGGTTLDHHQDQHDDIIMLCKRSTRTDQQFWIFTLVVEKYKLKAEVARWPHWMKRLSNIESSLSEILLKLTFQTKGN